MVTKKARKKKPNIGAETPITIGGGGGGSMPKLLVPLTITYNAAAWLPSNTSGTLTLPGGNVKKIIITTGDFELKLPVNGAVTIDLKCGRP